VNREQVLFRLFGKYCPEGTILYTEGSPGQELYVIQSGAVRLGSARPEGGPAALLGPGDLLGERSFFGQAARSDRAEVVRDARLIQVNDRTIGTVVRHGPRTAQVIFERLLTLARRARSELDLRNVERLLHRAAPNLTEAARGGIVPADLAERSGLAESDVLLVLEELLRRGCLVREGPNYRAPDAAVLQREIDGFTTAGERT
jgi:CRP-like cAMP-binding protein